MEGATECMLIDWRSEGGLRANHRLTSSREGIVKGIARSFWGEITWLRQGKDWRFQSSYFSAPYRFGTGWHLCSWSAFHLCSCRPGFGSSGRPPWTQRITAPSVLPPRLLCGQSNKIKGKKKAGFCALVLRRGTSMHAPSVPKTPVQVSASRNHKYVSH